MLIVFLVTLILKISQSEFVQLFHPLNSLQPPLKLKWPHSASLSFQPLENTTNLAEPKENLKFLLPFLDMEVQYNRNLHVLQEVKKRQIYILHGHELYQLFINRQDKRLSLIAVLEGSVRHVEPLEAKIIYWEGNFLLVIALEEHLEVYQLAEDVLTQRAESVKNPAIVYEPPPSFEAIQLLTLTGKFQNLFLVSPSEERVTIIAAVNFSKLYSKLRIFEWLNTYFNPIEDFTIPSIHVMNVIGSETKYLITGQTIKNAESTILTVYKINPLSYNLLLKQTLTVASRVVHMFTYRDHNMIVACSTKQQKCSSFRQAPDGHFSIYKRRTSEEFTFDVMISSTRFISAIRRNQVIVFTNHRLDCYGSFILDQNDVTNLIGYHNAHKENYVLLVYKRPFKALVRIVELELNVSSDEPSEAGETGTSDRHHSLFESTISELRSLLLQRKMIMDIFRKVSHLLKPKQRDIDVKERKVLLTGKVGTIRVIGESSKTPQQIVQRIQSLKENYLLQRPKRSDNQNDVNLNLTKRVKVKRMKVENLIYTGDVIEGFYLNETDLEQKLLIIKPKVTCHALNTSELILPPNMRETRQGTVHNLYSDLTSYHRVRQLEVESINGVPWNIFYESLFLKNRDKVIDGSLVMQSNVRVKHLITHNLNGLIVSKLLNLKHPQVIYSDLVISQFFVDDLQVKTLNGLIFEEDIVFCGSDTLIESPIKMQHLRISDNIFWANSTKVNYSSIYPEGCQQFYNNKVIINGSLFVTNLKRLNNETKIFLGDQEFDLNEINEKYLLREKNQNFSFPVIFEEASVTVFSLETNYLNEHQTDEYMLVDKVNTEKPLAAVFMNAHVLGDIMCRDCKSKLAELKENIIHPGEKATITGVKIFHGSLEITNAEVLTLNEIPVKDLVFKTIFKDNQTVEFKDTKTFSTIKVKKPAFIEQELNASYLNNLPLKSLLSNDYYIDRLYVPHMVETSNLVFHRINGIPLDEIFSKIDVKDERLVLHKDVLVEGNVEFVKNLKLNYINDILWNEYVNNLVRTTENPIIEGAVNFEQDLTVTKKLDATEINGYDLENTLRNVLLKSQPQLITGVYYFDNISGSNIDVRNINGVEVGQFLNLNENLTVIESDVIVEKLYIGGNLQGNFNEFERILYAEEKVKQLSLKPWKSLYVLNNVSWPEYIKDNGQQELLKYLYKYAVKMNRDQIITGNVKISKLFIRNMQTRMEFSPHLDLNFIQRDAVLKNSTVRQIIKGEKIFITSLKVENFTSKRDLNTQLLNKIDILSFNQSLYRVSSQEPLNSSFKFLQPLIVGHIQVNGLINGLNSTSIYQLENNSSLPDLQIEELYIENDLFIGNINDMSWEYFLDNRVTLTGPAIEHFGVLTFEHLVIAKQALMQSINGVAIDNMVFKRSAHLQIITGYKSLGHTLELVGPAHVMYLNYKNLMELYQNSLMSDRNYAFDNLFLEKATFERGLQVSNNSNNNMQQRSFPEIEDDEEKFIKFLTEFKENLTNSNNGIMYLDYDFNTHVKWLDSGALRPNQTTSHALFRSSVCEKKYLQISLELPHNIYLKNFTSNRLTEISNNISVKTENYCRSRNRTLKSKVTISGQNVLKVFAMKRYVENIYILDFVNASEHFVILHVLDLPSLRRNEVRIFRISTLNGTIDEWQYMTKNIGEHTKLYKFTNLQILITNGLIDHHPAVTIYHFNNDSRLFKMLQFISGDYDIMEMIDSPNKKATKQLVLSCSKCERVFIYELNKSKVCGEYQILQIITLQAPIDKLVTFRLKSENYMLVISQRDSNIYNIYKYAYIQGWLPLSMGYFPNLQMSIPVTALWTGEDSLISDGIPLIILCNVNDCYLIKAIL